ncbi:MAG: hypothetical protein JNK99_15570 [Candidatus Accumulibacter sp.]|uniref:lysozyme n=1 Tax=Accumulibacter sp. TaxID=2053492 RepID=UPI001A40D2DE|nr:hypothetical protein [Accumulibacter sp.]MBL8396139.1 hypothetical protein [Accumulibacter sp.]
MMVWFPEPDERAEKNNFRRTSADGLDLISRHTHFRPVPEPGRFGLSTVGYGHVLRPGEPRCVVDHAAALRLLRDDLRPIEIYLLATLPAALRQNEFDALISLILDIGICAYEHSEVREAVRCLDRDWVAAEIRAGPQLGEGPDWAVTDHFWRRNDEATLYLRGAEAMRRQWLDIDDEIGERNS